MDEPRRVPIHRSINRPQMWLGGERKLVQFALLIAVLIAISHLSLLTITYGVVFWITCLAILHRLAKADLQMSKVYIRSLSYLPFYPARSGLYAVTKKVKDWRVK